MTILVKSLGQQNNDMFKIRRSHSPNRQTVPQARESDVLIDPSHGGAGAFARFAVGVEFGDHDIGGVGDNGAEDTGEVTGREGHARLGAFGVVGFLAGEAGVHHFDDGFEGGKFLCKNWVSCDCWELAGMIEVRRQILTTSKYLDRSRGSSDYR